MKEKVLEAINKYRLLNGGETVTVALSGGADSVALLYALNCLKEELGITLKAAHLNHNIRGAEALRDAEFSEKLCARLGVEFTCGSIDVPAAARLNKQSLELAARLCRYGFLAEVAGEGVIATAHNADDNLETVLFNLTRGSALSGLCGIPPKRDNFIRPLILCSKQEIEAYCTENKLDFVIDSTNLSEDYTRNKIRHRVIPTLKEINPAAAAAASRASEQLFEDKAFIDKEVGKLYSVAVSPKGIDAMLLSQSPKSLAVRVLKKYYEEHFNGELSYSHLSELYGLCFNASQIVLPQKIKAYRSVGYIIMESIASQEKALYETEILKENIKNVNTLFFNNAADCDKIVGELRIRARLAGDKIKLKAGGYTKTLKKLYNEYKIPENKRENLPIVADDKGVVWICGIGVASRVQPDDKTESVYIFKGREINGK